MGKWLKLPVKSKPQEPLKSNSSTVALKREQFIKKILAERGGEILEIGPLNRPLITADFMRYFDLLPTDQLRERAVEQGLNPKTVPEINFHDVNGDLSVISEKFSDVISAHCLEHQPDLIRHLQKVSKILDSHTGRYWLVLPDKRYCFDALLPETKISEVIEAFEGEFKKPSIWKVLEHRALTTHNDPVEHWAGNHGLPNADLKNRWSAAKDEFKKSAGSYIDVHCWQFTPQSIVNLIDGLFELGYIDFIVEEVFETPENDLEFCMILKKSQT
jgi:hypothetical protein